MKVTIQPEEDYICLIDYVEKNHRAIEELIIVPQSRIGFSGARLYLYYFKRKNIYSFSIPFFFKIAGEECSNSLEQEVNAYNEYVESVLDGVQAVKPILKKEVNDKNFYFFSSPAVGIEPNEMTKNNFQNLSVITFEELLKLKDNLKGNKFEQLKEKLISALNHTFNEILSPWIGKVPFEPSINNQDQEMYCEFNWKEEYKWSLRWDKSKNNLENILGEHKNKIFIDLQGVKCINPLHFIEETVLKSTFKGKKRITHGDLHLRNLMVSNSLETRNVFLIDFGWTDGNSHCLKDYCLLEFSLKFIHLSKELNDDEFLLFEKALDLNKYPEKLDSKNTRLIFDIIVHIRELSKRECTKENWRQEYLTALLLITTGSLGINGFDGLDARAVYSSISWMSNELFSINSTDEFLYQYGEKELLDKFIISKLNDSLTKYDDIVIPLGDDCTGIKLTKPDNILITSTDPCPIPVAWLLGDMDYYHYGWYSMLINLSDLASMGAKPSGILLSCVMPNHMKVSEYLNFMEGIEFLSDKFSCPVIGGNIKDGKSFDVNATIFGQVTRNRVLKRQGAKKNDKILVIGRLGEFWTSVLGIKYFINNYDENQVDWFWEKIRRPIPKVSQGIFLAEGNFATSCIDNSDGLTGCFYELAKKNKLDVIIEDDKIMGNISPITLDIASKLKIDPVKIALNWGDWQLLCTVPDDKYEQFKNEVSIYNQKNVNDKFEFIEVGYLREIEAKIPQVKYIKNQSEFILTNFENERFSHISYFTHGLNNYIKYLKEFELYTKI